MGVELYITRAEDWAENDGQKISSKEWMELVDSDPELTLSPENGEYFVIWSAASEYEDPWLDWCDGNISTKWPDTALYKKMLSLADQLGAKVQDDDGTVYPDQVHWEFNPNQLPEDAHTTGKPWWRFW